MPGPTLHAKEQVLRGGGAASSLPLELRVSWSTLLRVFAAILAAFVAVKLWPSLCLLLLSVLIALTLSPALAWFEGRGLSRGRGVAILALGALATLALVFVVVVPPLGQQLNSLVENLPSIRATLLHRLAFEHAFLHRVVLQIFDVPESPEGAAILK